MSEQDEKQPEARPPSQPDPDSTGIFCWYQDLWERILPSKEKERPK